MRISRRTALAGAATLPLATTLGGAATPAAAQAAAPASAGAHSFDLGAFRVTALMAGNRTVDENIQGIFGMNVDAETFGEVSRENFIPADKAQFFFTPTVVDTGSEVVLFDTGLNADGITGALANAGYTPDQIGVVVLTHGHGDHVGGLMKDGQPTFANARYVYGQADFDHWSMAGNEAFEANVMPLADRIDFVGDGASVVSGITGMAAFGHTPGHMVYMLESEGEQLMLTADTANHYVWSLAYPDWEVRFDIDKAAAAESRRKVFGMIAADRIPFIGYHMPFPSLGYVEARGDGFRYVPATYQMML